MRDVRRKDAIVYVLTKGGKEKPIIMTVEDARKAKQGKHSKIDPADIVDVNWNPTIGQLRYAQQSGAKSMDIRKKTESEKLTCKKCGKTFYEYRSVSDKFVQETASGPGAAFCKKCWKKITGKGPTKKTKQSKYVGVGILS